MLLLCVYPLGMLGETQMRCVIWRERSKGVRERECRGRAYVAFCSRPAPLEPSSWVVLLHWMKDKEAKHRETIGLFADDVANGGGVGREASCCGTKGPLERDDDDAWGVWSGLDLVLAGRREMGR